ncbi:MAG TPA: amidohydrolase family protein, partial [Anaerolineales bacterium]
HGFVPVSQIQSWSEVPADTALFESLLVCEEPARLFGLAPDKGAIRPGADADLVIVDLDREWTLTADQLFYKNQFSAYVGCTFQGQVERTLVRGVTVYQDGKILVEPGFGKLLRRGTSYAF